ncbi:hypothetical protein [Clostridium tertium]|uniref:hypothetical protein n=1 Tax=Clostridium tertium TaxID=1559 RepID=UPI003DA1CDA5
MNDIEQFITDFCRSEQRVFRGKNVDIRPHYIDEGTYQLCKAGTRNVLCIGTLEQVLQEYDKMNK